MLSNNAKEAGGVVLVVGRAEPSLDQALGLRQSSLS